MLDTDRDRPTLTVAICTRNRAALAERAVASVLRHDRGIDRFELLLIDSGSDEQHRQALAELSAREPRVALVRVDAAGLSQALNIALERARAGIVAYLDDDAEAEPGWAAAILAAFRTAEPRPAVVGGPIVPVFAAPKPLWWPNAYLPLLTISEGQPQGFVAPGSSCIFGANVAYDKDAVLAIGGFPTHLGRDGVRLLGGEEAWVNYQLAARGGRLFYASSAAVRHLVAADRLTFRWLRERLYWEGVTEAFLMRHFRPGELPGKFLREAMKLMLLSPFVLPVAVGRYTAGTTRQAGRLSFARGFLRACLSGDTGHLPRSAPASG